MPRRLRCASAGFVYHVLNRAVGRATLFDKEGDYAAFVKVLRQAKEWQPMRLLAYCLMPNHWHLVLWPHEDGDLSEFMRWLTVTHPRNWLAWVNRSETAKELAAVRRSVVRGCPFGGESWQHKTAKALGLEATLRPRGRPAKKSG